jgi:membrane-associated PAP2 superfamily phosphatase
MSVNKQIVLHIIVLLGIVWLFEGTNLDLLLQDHFYFWDCHKWMIDKRDPVLRLFFYTGVKILIIIFGATCFFGCLLSFKIHILAKYRRFYVLICLALISVPVTVAVLKSFSNVYTPSQIKRYGGAYPYVKVFERYSPEFQQIKKGKGWPAGHASGGFALMMLYEAFERKRLKIAGLMIGLIIGWTMGLYQMLKGAHFLSHTIISMSIAWILILVISRTTQTSPIKRFFN